MFEDRPIKKPDPNELEEMKKTAREERMKAAKRFLQKGNPNLLPCYKENQAKNSTSRSLSPKSKLTKAQQYEQIKRQNRQKFGQWHKHKSQVQPKKQQKLDPRKMTVNYKPKTPKIDTREYRKPGYIETESQKERRKQNAEELNQKMEYKRMVQYMKKLYGDFEREKELFQKERDYLKFKKTIQQEPGLEIKSKVNTGLVHNPKTNMAQPLPNFPKSRPEMPREQKEEEDPQQPNEQTIQKFHYPINKLHECHPFTLRQVHKYVRVQDLIPENNSFYNEAKNLLESQVNNRRTKTIKPKCTHGSLGANHSVCLEDQCAEKRVSKFEGCWFEVWVAGRYRTIYNQGLGLKIVWYGNGDIKQEFTKDKIEIYHSKAKKVVQVTVGANLPFWYYPAIGQLEMKDKQGNTEVIFADGRHEIVVSSESK